MSFKSTLLVTGIVIAVLVASHYAVHIVTKNIVTEDVLASITQDSVVTVIDTVRVPYPDPFPVYLERTIDADIDTVDNIITYSTQLDTTIIIDGDTVAVINQDISLTEGIFNILMNIELRPIEKTITITETVYQTITKEVPSSPPFYNTWIVGFISGVISFLILVISLT